MSKVLVVDNDSVSGILTADRLRIEGFLVVLHEALYGVPKRAVEEYADAVVVATGPSQLAFDILAELRKDPRTSSLPILLLLDGRQAGEGLRALREGANHYLIKPYDSEELALQLHRLVSTRSPGRFLLEGDLSYYPFWELLQFLHQGGKSGRLSFALHRKPADLTLVEGHVHEARFGKLRGSEAVLAMNGLEEGHFRFVPGLREIEQPVLAVKPVKSLLMEAAWLRDELEARRSVLPERGEELRVRAEVPPEPPPEMRDLPIAETFELIRSHPGTSLAGLLRAEIAAPQTVELALVLLLDGGAVVRVSNLSSKPPSTREIHANVLLEATVDDLLGRTRGGADSTLRLLLLAEPEAWDDLAAVFRSLPSGNGSSPWEALADQVEQRQAGSTTVRRPTATLSVVVQLLRPAVLPRVEAILPLCHGVGLWLGDKGVSGVERIIRRLELGDGPEAAVLVTAKGSAEDRLGTLARELQRWRVCPKPPRSLLAVLQLFD